MTQLVRYFRQRGNRRNNKILPTNVNRVSPAVKTDLNYGNISKKITTDIFKPWAASLFFSLGECCLSVLNDNLANH